MSKLLKSILLLGFFVCLTSLAFAGGNNNNGNHNGQGDHEWCPPDNEGEEGEEGNLVECSADETCYLYVNVICPISITCSGDQEITICQDQDLTEEDLADFTFNFMIGGAAGATYSFTVTVPEQAETQNPLTGTETALTTTGISVLIDANGLHADSQTDLGDVTTTTGDDFVFTSGEYTLFAGDNDAGACIDPDDQAVVTVYFLGLLTDATTQVGLQRFPIMVHAEYVI